MQLAQAIYGSTGLKEGGSNGVQGMGLFDSQTTCIDGHSTTGGDLGLPSWTFAKIIWMFSQQKALNVHYHNREYSRETQHLVLSNYNIFGIECIHRVSSPQRSAQLGTNASITHLFTNRK